jgi:hypothetical protein
LILQQKLQPKPAFLFTTKHTVGECSLRQILPEILLKKIQRYKLTLDISHWCNVHESLLADQQETVQLALSRVGNIHARIGHEEGPQVNDPRAPEWESALKAHLGWWDAVVAQKVKSGEGLTILTEFGPPNYLPTVPYTKQPLADQWEINVYMMRMLRDRYLKL